MEGEHIPIKLQNTHADTQLALVDTGCTHTCMSEENGLQTDREDCAFSTCGGEAKGISQTITLKIVGQAIIHVYLFTEDHQLLRLRTRCLIVNQLSTPFFLGRDVFKNSKVMESIRPEGLYIHCHGKSHKIPFVEEKAAIGMTGKLQPSIKAIEMEINDNHLYTLTSYKL